jgi:hypothetical protein
MSQNWRGRVDMAGRVLWRKADLRGLLVARAALALACDQRHASLPASGRFRSHWAVTRHPLNHTAQRSERFGSHDLTAKI